MPLAAALIWIEPISTLASPSTPLAVASIRTAAFELTVSFSVAVVVMVSEPPPVTVPFARASA